MPKIDTPNPGEWTDKDRERYAVEVCNLQKHRLDPTWRDSFGHAVYSCRDYHPDTDINQALAGFDYGKYRIYIHSQEPEIQTGLVWFRVEITERYGVKPSTVVLVRGTLAHAICVARWGAARGDDE